MATLRPRARANGWGKKQSAARHLAARAWPTGITPQGSDLVVDAHCMA